MSSVGSNKGSASSVTGTNTNAKEQPNPSSKENETNSEEPVSNDEKESTLTSTDLEQDASIRKRKRVVGSDSEIPSTPATIGLESPVDSNTLLKRKKSENAKADSALDDSLDEDDAHQNNNGSSLNVNSGLQANVDILEELYTLRASLANVVAKLPKQPASSKSPLQSNQPWGSLVPSNSQQATVVLKGNTFTVGRNSKCSMCIGDTHIASVLFKIHYSNGVALFESTSNNGTTYINGKVYKRNSKIVLKEGDEITINGSKVYSYTFREATATTTSTTAAATPSTATPMSVDSKDSAVATTTTTTTTTSAASPISAAVRNRRRGPQFMPSPSFVPPPLSDDPVTLPHSSFLASLFPVTNNNNDSTTPAATAESLRKKYKEEFSKNIISFKDITTSFDKFPYYLQDNVKHQLINSAYIYLKRPDYVKYLTESPITRRLMICGPNGTELYQESLAKALAFEFKANLLIVEASTLDIEKDKEKEKEKAEEYSSDELDDWDPEIRPRKERKMGLGRLMRSGNRSNNKVVITVAEGSERRSYDATNETKEEDKSELEILWETLIDSVSDTSQPHILFIKDIESLFFTPSFKQLNLKKIFSKITSPLFIIGSSVSVEMRRENTMQSGLLVSKGNASHTTALLDIAFLDHFARLGERAKDRDKVTKISNKLFPNKINIVVPTDSNELSEWTNKINQDVEQIKMEKNAKNLRKIMDKNQVQVEEVSTPLFSKTVYSPESIEKIAGFAISHHIMHTEDSNLQEGNMMVSLKSLEHGIKILKNVESGGKPKNLKDIEPENDFERRLLSEVIPPTEIEIKFEDIGALDDVKQTLKELVMLPLRRPELFARGNLTKPTKGILLFGPPGTGKTMLAKAVATQCGANFINISMSSIASKWFGECEKFVKAIFTLASKISPTVIFVDEVDSMLGKRDKHGEHETMRKIKNEFMSNWDGLKSRDGERVIVLAATNRPFDLDDAVLRRLPRRILVDLPDKDNRAKILKVILGKEDLEPDFDFAELAQMTEGYSGSDMKNLSIAAAYKPIREVLQKEKEEGTSESEVKTEIKLRALTMKDFEKSLEEVSASVSEDAVSIGELRKWNDLYGEKGSRKKQLLPYFL